MRRRPRPEEEPELFDLPLSDDPLPEPPPPAEPARVAPEPAANEGELPLYPELGSDGEPWLDETREVAADDDPQPPAEESDPAATEPVGPRFAPPLPRLVSGLLDFAVLLAVSVAVWTGLRWMGVWLSIDDWPAVVTFHLAFSFLYFVLPLAFWGRTPGMSRIGLVARATNGDHLSFGQSASRWLGALITGCLLAIPLLLSLTGRSLSDRLSASETLIA